VLRPKADRRSAHFYTLVSLRTCEEFARHRQLFLAEQGYSYRIEIYVVVILCCKLPGINYTCIGMEKIPEVISAI